MAYGVDYLRSKLSIKKSRVKTRYAFYEMKNTVKDFGISTPPSLRHIQSVLGWCAKSVDHMSDRLQLYGFENDVLQMQAIYDFNNPAVLYDSAIVSSLIGSCSFLSITRDSEDFPRIQVIDAGNATGIMDEVTGFLKEGYAVLSTDEYGNAISEAYYEPGYTTFFENGNVVARVQNYAPYPLLVPVVFRPNPKRPFGYSRISRSCMSIVQSACRTIKRSEVSSEFYSFPQKYLLGTSQDLEIEDKWKASMSALLMISEDDEGRHPIAGSFQQASMTPHIEQLKMFAGLFAAETGLTVDDLGFPSENPSSQEAIKAQHETLRLACRKAQKNYSYAFKMAGYLSACEINKMPIQMAAMTDTKVLWEPLFEPDAAMLSSIGDGVIKLNQAIEGYVTEDKMRNLTGF